MRSRRSRVVELTVDGEHVFCPQVGQGDACAVDDICQVQFGAVELNGVDAVVDDLMRFLRRGVAGAMDGGDGRTRGPMLAGSTCTS